jgi:hypothetical protein
MGDAGRELPDRLEPARRDDRRLQPLDLGDVGADQQHAAADLAVVADRSRRHFEQRGLAVVTLVAQLVETQARAFAATQFDEVAHALEAVGHRDVRQRSTEHGFAARFPIQARRLPWRANRLAESTVAASA